MAAGPQSSGVKNEINVTPLVDVVLVLLIIFMVITPMLQRGKDVQLPEAKQIDEDKKDADPVILSLTKDKDLYVENDKYDDAGFEDRIRSELEKQPGRKLLLKGDERLTFGDVRRVMDLARKAGAKSVALGVQEQKK